MELSRHSPPPEVQATNMVVPSWRITPSHKGIPVISVKLLLVAAEVPHRPHRPDIGCIKRSIWI